MMSVNSEVHLILTGSLYLDETKGALGSLVVHDRLRIYRNERKPMLISSKRIVSLCISPVPKNIIYNPSPTASL